MENKLIGYADDSNLMAVVPSPGARVAAAESLIPDLSRDGKWCDPLGMKLNASKTKTMIVLWSRTMHPQSPPLTIGGTLRNSLMTLLGVTFDSKITFEKHLRFASRAASQRLGILRKSWRVFHDRSLLGDAFGVLSCQFWSTVLQSGARLQIHTLNYWTVLSMVPCF